MTLSFSLLDVMTFRRRAAISLVVMWLATIPAFGQAFTRFSVSAGQFGGNFTTDVRVNPTNGAGEGTSLGLERDLGLTSSQNVHRFAIEWRPFNRHELAANYVSANRNGFASLNREVVFQDRVYPVSADVSTVFNTSKWEATYTYWAARSDRGGFGIEIGAAGLTIDASLLAQQPGQTLTISQNASTNVPVGLIGAQVRYAFTDRIAGRASAAALPNVKIDVYSGSATTADARLEFRIVKGIAIGAAYNYFHLDGTIADPEFGGALSMKVGGPEAYLRLGW
jgi:hypothetical protein